MSFKAWVIFVPLWMTFDLYRRRLQPLGRRLAGADGRGRLLRRLRHPSGGGISGFVAAAIVGPRLQADRDTSSPTACCMTLAGAGILWLGWNGFNGGDPYFANADAGAAVLNTNIATCVGRCWSGRCMDSSSTASPR